MADQPIVRLVLADILAELKKDRQQITDDVASFLKQKRHVLPEDIRMQTYLVTAAILHACDILLLKLTCDANEDNERGETGATH